MGASWTTDTPHLGNTGFNSDVYDNWVNPLGVGNGGSVLAGGPPMHDLPHSTNIVIPANGLLVFALDAGD